MWARLGQADIFDRHYKRGLALYQQKEYAAAIEEMQAAYSERQLPRLLLNIGQAYRKMGKAREALSYYEQYMKAEPDAPAAIKTEIGQYIEQTRALIETPTVREPGKEPPPDGVSHDPNKNPANTTAKPKDDRPLYKKPWFWGIIGGAVAVTIIVGVSVGVATSHQAPSGIDIIQF